MRKFFLGIGIVVALLCATEALAGSILDTCQLGFWSRKDQIWVQVHNVHAYSVSTLISSTIYIPPANAVAHLTTGVKTKIYFTLKGKQVWVFADDLTNNPVETEMWGKLLIKARHSGYSYLYEFLEEVICRTPSESAPYVMNELYNDIQLAFACNTRRFPTSPRGIFYCLEEYTRLKLAGRVPINDPAGEEKLIEIGRPAFRKEILLPNHMIDRLPD